MSRRFYSPQPIDGERATLEGSEAHHLSHVLRASVDDEVILFDGRGSEYVARVRAISRKRVEFEVLECRCPTRELPRRLEIAIALPRGDRQEWLTQKLVELGVGQLIPWHTTRSVAVAHEKTMRRLRRYVIEASKQCGRNTLMQIEPPAPFREVLEQSSTSIQLLAHPLEDAPSLPSLGDQLESSAGGSVRIGVGPEGGFTAEEVESAAMNGWQVVGLGPRILRTETAAVTLAAWFHLQWL